MKILSPAQTEIMLAIWEAGKPLKRSELQELMTEREWKTPTINTFLSKLVENGFLEIEHERRDYVYHAVISKKEYLEYESSIRMKKLYGNSIENVLSAFCPNDTVTDKEIEEIEHYLKKLKGE